MNGLLWAVIAFFVGTLIVPLILKWVDYSRSVKANEDSLKRDLAQKTEKTIEELKSQVQDLERNYNSLVGKIAANELASAKQVMFCKDEFVSKDALDKALEESRRRLIFLIKLLKKDIDTLAGSGGSFDLVEEDDE